MCCRQFELNLEVELDNDPGTFGGSSTNRKCTDVFALLLMVLILGGVVGLSVYCFLNSDVEKLLNGYDDSGNICGKNNFKTDLMPSYVVVKNMEQKKYVYIKSVEGALGQTRECVENCTMRGTSLFSNYCVSDKNLVPYYIIMQQYWMFILVSFFGSALGVGVSYCETQITLKKPDLQYLFCLGLIIGISNVALRIAYNYCIFDVFLILVIIVMIALLLNYLSLFSKQIILKLNLVNQLHQDVWETLKSMTLFWLLPLLSISIIIILVFGLVYGWIWLQPFSYPKQIDGSNGSKILYVQYPIATVTQALLVYAFFLIYEFVNNCQCMIVGGYVAQWHYTRRDGELTQPIRRTTRNLLKYHLGSICCASLILPIVYVVHAVVNTIKGASSGHNKETVITCSCHLFSATCLATFITWLSLFTRNGLIMTAMYGCSFSAGSIRAHKLIHHSSFNLVKINTIRDPINPLKIVNWLFCFLWYSFLVKYSNYHDLKQEQIICIKYVILSLILIYLGSSVIDIAKDTLFLCFCEDYLYNNDSLKPFNMSPNFAQYIEDANKFVDPVKWKEVADKWGKGPKRLYE